VAALLAAQGHGLPSDNPTKAVADALANLTKAGRALRVDRGRYVISPTGRRGFIDKAPPGREVYR
jgi:hypothetical protein